MNHIGIFLDRDGTINEEVDYLTSPRQLRLIPGSADAIRSANELGARVFIVTNQSAVARGLMTERHLEEIHKRLRELLLESGARIDAIYYCPHPADSTDHPTAPQCNCRKPSIGMLLKAADEFGVDLRKSFMIGDKLIDVQTGMNAGASTILVLTGYGKQELERCTQQGIHPDHVAGNLYDAVRHVRQMVRRELSSTP